MAVKDSSGNIVCNVSLTSSASLYPGCVPLDFIGARQRVPGGSELYFSEHGLYDPEHTG